VDEGVQLAERQEIGQIESKKAESSLYAPIAGRLARFNPQLLSDPSAINVDKYGEGWLFEIEGSGEPLLAPPQYIDHLAAVWEVTQRTIKGQVNE
jgi:glycine cleavage system H protein